MSDITLTFERLENFASPFIGGVKNKVWKSLLEIFDYYRVKVKVHQKLPEEVITVPNTLACILFKPKYSNTWCLVPEHFIERKHILTALSLEYISTKNNKSVIYSVSLEVKTSDSLYRQQPQSVTNSYLYSQQTTPIYELLLQNLDIKIDHSRFSIFSSFVKASRLSLQVISNYSMNNSYICGALLVSNQLKKENLIKNSLDPSKMTLIGNSNSCEGHQRLHPSLPNCFSMPFNWRYTGDIESVYIESCFYIFNKLTTNVNFAVSKILTPGLAEELGLPFEHSLRTRADIHNLHKIASKFVKISVEHSTYIPEGSYFIDDTKFPLVLTERADLIPWLHETNFMYLDQNLNFLETSGVYLGALGLVLSNPLLLKKGVGLNNLSQIKQAWKAICFDSVNYTPSTASLQPANLEPIPMRQVYNL